MKEATIYLDTNILSRIPDLRISETTANAFANLANLGGVKLVTSQKTKQEILGTRNTSRGSILQFLYALIDKVPLQTVHYSGCIGGAPIGATPIGGDWTDPLWAELKTVFDPDDAEHIVHAVRAGCDYFLTLDRETILDRAITNQDIIKKSCGKLLFVSPEEVVEAIQKQRNISQRSGPGLSKS